MMEKDDDVALDEELHWSESRNKGLIKKLLNSKPAGVHAIQLLSSFYTLFMWLVTLMVAAKFQGRPSGYVVDPLSLVILLILGIELFVAGPLARRTWIMIGPSLRELSRPYFKYGMWPPFFAVLFILILGGKFMSRHLQFSMTPSNWKIVTPARSSSTEVIYGTAVRMCEQEGEEWSVPELSDLGRFSPRFQPGEGDRYWIRQKQIGPTRGDLLWSQCSGTSCENQVSTFEGNDQAQLKALVVCFKH